MSQSTDEFGRSGESGGIDDCHPQIEESPGTLRLHFHALDVQSEMYKHAPYELVLSYTRTMMDALRLQPRLRHIGMVGLGGGSMLKYCYRQFPDAFISVAEISPEVIALRDKFFIPEDDHRLKVFCEDGADFVQRHPRSFDALVVDGFDQSGQPPQLCSLQFYRDCYRSLVSRGLLVANLYNGYHLASRVRRSFGDQVIFAPGDGGSDNTIILAGKGKVLTEITEDPAPANSPQAPRKPVIGIASAPGSAARSTTLFPPKKPPVKFFG